MSDKVMDLEQTKSLFEFLQGNNQSEVIEFKDGSIPKLTPEQAFSVIYYLQEELKVIPDVYEKCDECHEIFNTDSEGRQNLKSHKFFCDGCLHLDDVDDSEEQ